MGRIAGTIPDLDALVDHGDPIRNMTFHRTESHSLFYLTLFSAAARLGRDAAARRAALPPLVAGAVGGAGHAPAARR